MKKLKFSRWLSKRFITIVVIFIATFLTVITTTEIGFSLPQQAEILKIVDSVAFPRQGQVDLRRTAPSRPSRTESGKKGLKINAFDILQITRQLVTLNFSKEQIEAVIGGDRNPTTYIFPGKVIGGKNAFGWRGEFLINKETRRIKVFPSGGRTKVSNFPTNLVAQATTDILPVSSVGEIRYCSALSDFSVIPEPIPEYGKAWGVGISRQGGDIFSQNDPCRKALRECESDHQNLRRVANPKLGTRCSIVSRGIQLVDDSRIVLSLDCSGNAANPFLRNSYSYPISASQLNDDQFIGEIKNKARTEQARSCIFDIDPDIPGSRIITPYQPNKKILEIKVDATGKEVEILTSSGSVEVRPINPKEGEPIRIVPGRSKYFYSPDEEKYKVVPASDEEVDEARQNQPLILLSRDPTVISSAQVAGLLTASGKRVMPWEKLGFYLNLPSWKAISERNDLETVLEQIKQKEPPLAFTYINGALGLLERKDPKLAAVFQGEVNGYLKPKLESRFLAFDFGDLASISAEKRSLTSGDSIETIAKDYVQQLRKTRSSVIKYMSHRSIQVGDVDNVSKFKVWEVKTRINLQGSFGAPNRGYQKDPRIGAGKTVFVEGTNGKPIALIQTSYLINYQNTYFKLDFVTTDNRDELYTKAYKTILDSFRIIEPQLSST